MKKNQFTLHPWHGVEVGEKAPNIVNVFIEIVPSDILKYEIDKPSGIVKIDRPQKYSNIVPCLYGFIPQTYCDTAVAEWAKSKSELEIVQGDHDPLDVCVLTSYHIPRGNILLKAKPIGGFRMIDHGEADDKIIAVLVDDEIYGKFNSIFEVEPSVIQRLKHYFLTYKNLPDASPLCIIDAEYDQEEARQIIQASRKDYVNNFSE
ncbi:MAG: inorganic pyrophosphatase [Chitinophagales bacterium]|nr:inorganic pyrophosphatase [Chitinophagales bacterium]